MAVIRATTANSFSIKCFFFTLFLNSVSFHFRPGQSDVHMYVLKTPFLFFFLFLFLFFFLLLLFFFFFFLFFLVFFLFFFYFFLFFFLLFFFLLFFFSFFFFLFLRFFGLFPVHDILGFLPPVNLASCRCASF